MKKLALFLCSVALVFNYTAIRAESSPSVEQKPAPIGVYSPAIKAGDLIFISGQLGSDPKTGKILNENFTQEFSQAIENVAAIAKENGGSLNDIVKVTVFLTDLNHYSDVNKVMQQYFKKPYPARSVVEVKGLVGQASVEIETIMKKN